MSHRALPRARHSLTLGRDCQPKAATLCVPPIGASPSGKASVFGTDIPRFESWRPSQDLGRTTADSASDPVASMSGSSGERCRRRSTKRANVLRGRSGPTSWMRKVFWSSRWPGLEAELGDADPLLARIPGLGASRTRHGRCGAKPFRRSASAAADRSHLKGARRLEQAAAMHVPVAAVSGNVPGSGVDRR